MSKTQARFDTHSIHRSQHGLSPFVERRHRRAGVATKLLDWMFANVWHTKPVRLDVFVHNATAIAFYEAYGFRVGVLRMEKPSGSGGSAR